MTLRCIPVAADAALPALADAVHGAKRGDPLAPVTVVVPTNAVGVTARRWLGGHGGIAAIELVTPYRLAERVAGAELASAGRSPVSIPLIDITIRSVLDTDPGGFAAVAQHPSTITSLRDLYREVRVAGSAAVERLASSSARGAEVARVVDATTTLLSPSWFDEGDLLRSAIDLLRGGRDGLTEVVAFLPRPSADLTAELVRTIGERASLQAIIEITGVDELDAEAAAFVVALGGTMPDHAEPDPVGTTAGTAVTVVSTSDADEEVRDAVRRTVAAARDGTPFARMAIVWPVDQPYARLVEHHLTTAGIPWNGRPGTLVTERLVPRFLLDLLQLDRRGLRRNDVFDLLADVPIRAPGGGRVSVGRWERIARTAGVDRDEHWEPRLLALAARLRDPERLREHDADAAEELASFVSELRRDLGGRSRRRSWRDWAEWCERQVLRRLGPSVLDQLDEAERLASDHASRVLDRLAHLDAVSEPVTRSRFRAAFAAEFEAAPGRLGRLGNGVTVGSLAGTVGLDADLTIVLGASDGQLPPAPPSDPLISDADRRSAGLAGADARVHRMQRALLGHLRTSHRSVLSTPRGDLRATTTRLPSRWIADHAPDATSRIVGSHHAGTIATSFPPDATAFRLRARAVAAMTGVDELVRVCAEDPVASRALAMRAARRSDRITEYDGDLSGETIEHFDRPVSASQLEAWPACPHAYFMRYLLGVRPLDDGDEDMALSPLERGNVVHETLDRFHRLVVDGALPQPSGDGWTSIHRAELERLYDEVADEFEQTGRTGRAAHWFLDRRAVRDDLLRWFALDGATVADRDAEVLHSELRFGHDRVVELPTPDGRRLAVTGFVDRIDRRPDGDLVVMDHKTGKADRFAGVTADDPTEGATKFQLPVYAAAALSLCGEQVDGTGIRVRAEYDFFGRGRYARLGYTFDRSVWEHVGRDLAHVVAGIESGLYPAVTDPPKFEYYIGCHYCQPDGLGVDERYEEWARKRSDPRLAPWFAVEGADDDG